MHPVCLSRAFDSSIRVFQVDNECAEHSTLAQMSDQTVHISGKGSINSQRKNGMDAS